MDTEKINERRSYQCSCGSTLYYQKDGVVYCAMAMCQRIIAPVMRRKDDAKIPTYHGLKETFNGK